MSASGTASDPFDLQRFVSAQEDSFVRAVEELARGRKESHWMWYVFPQVAGLGGSGMSRRYAIRARAEAQAYLAHPILGPRLAQAAATLLEVQGRTACEIMGQPDDVKLRSSMTLFAQVAPDGSVFRRVLDRYFAGEPDLRTLEILRAFET
jgi:uncharacterized protein (DUF1810 family)